MTKALKLLPLLAVPVLFVEGSATRLLWQGPPLQGFYEVGEEGKARSRVSASATSPNVPLLEGRSPLPSSVGADPFAQVGARTEFDRSAAIDIREFCAPAEQDHTACIQRWLAAGRSSGRPLFASPGVYNYSSSRRLYNGVQIMCADPETTVFRNTSRSGANFILAANSGGGPYPYQDIRIENCGFDVNAAQNNFASVIIINGGGGDPANWSRNITIRGNRFFDSSQPGEMYVDRRRQRQYVLVLAAQDVLIENNRLSEGGRIKAGRPGARIAIRGNRLHNINDNGITVVNTGTHSASHYLIENNTIINALGSGIFFGSDGTGAGTPEQVVQDVIIRGNTISGGQARCIHGTLPNHTRRVYIHNNTCSKVPVPAGYTYESSFDSGISFNRASGSSLPVEQLTVEGNTIRSAAGSFGNGAIFARGWHLNTCLLNNIFDIGTATAMRLDFGGRGTGKALQNSLNGARMRIDSGEVEQRGTASGCYRA